MQKNMAIQSKNAKMDLLARTVRQLFLITTSTSDPCDSVAFTTRHPILHALQERKKSSDGEIDGRSVAFGSKTRFVCSSHDRVPSKAGGRTLSL